MGGYFKGHPHTTELHLIDHMLGSHEMGDKSGKALPHAVSSYTVSDLSS